jgi:ADP-ribose pyrophosphatase YjhB (NUDIX family)
METVETDYISEDQDTDLLDEMYEERSSGERLCADASSIEKRNISEGSEIRSIEAPTQYDGDAKHRRHIEKRNISEGSEMRSIEAPTQYDGDAKHRRHIGKRNTGKQNTNRSVETREVQSPDKIRSFVPSSSRIVRNQNNCNNCGKSGHLFHQCKMPITSIGIILFRIKPDSPKTLLLANGCVRTLPPRISSSDDSASYEYLIIRRKETLGYIDFMRGKYSIQNKDYIMNMLKQMTNKEKQQLLSKTFDLLWKNIWGSSANSCQYVPLKNSLLPGLCDSHIPPPKVAICSADDVKHQRHVSKGSETRSVGDSTQYGEDVKHQRHVTDLHEAPLRGADSNLNRYKSEEINSREKYYTLINGVKLYNDYYNLESLICESSVYQSWEEPEWGFPKGRRNNQENDFDCAVREFSEETGYSVDKLVFLQNVAPYEEIFTGSNYKSYKHKYFLMYMNYEDTLEVGQYQTSEVSMIAWKTCEECIQCFRPYNLEKIRILKKVDEGLKRHMQISIEDSSLGKNRM